MLPQKPDNKRKPTFEKLEERVVFSADGLLIANVDIADPVENLHQPIEIQPFSSAVEGNQAELDYVVNEYELDGSGQTVAVIDSGIAWDHAALGGGYGNGHRVVGGWDFAEGDANPYDDGPAGFHGTHVTGIIGAQSEIYPGVAPGVDLVGLRVFDDSGKGNLDWVEQALNWVHENKDSFRNPITTVNLSLGTEWNSDNLPGWASLEDEFAKLEQDGIFISVAAGNSFKKYNAQGLSYPAVSDHVVPVASHDADGNISDFSQRDSRVLVAPGNSIKSTVPDHFFGGSKNDAFIGSSGTSMAAPYVAGASTLLREAFEFMGYSNVDQDRIYNQFLQTADKIFDDVTGHFYNRINIEKAIDSVIGDDYADARQNAFNIGNLGTNEHSLNGIMGGKSDVDWFNFRATKSGEAVIEFTGDGLTPDFFVASTQFTVEGNQLRFQVKAGQEYQFSVAAEEALGHFQLDSRIENSLQTTDIGIVTSKKLDAQSVAGTKWFEMKSGRGGVLTLQTIYGNAGNQLTLEVYNSNMELIAEGISNQIQSRVDAITNAGETYFLKVTGTNQDFDLRVSNFVSFQGNDLIVNGTSGNDTVTVDMTSGLSFTVNNVGYQFKTANLDTINIQGLDGGDRIKVATGSGDQATLRNGGISVSGGNVDLNADHFYSVEAAGQGIGDRVTFVDSGGSDFLKYSEGQAEMFSGGYVKIANGYRETVAFLDQEFDIARLFGSGGNDVLSINDDAASLKSDGRSIFVRGWNDLVVDMFGGNDFSNLQGTGSSDHFDLIAGKSSRTSDTSSLTVLNSERVDAYATNWEDSVEIHGSAGNDRLLADYDQATLTNGVHTVVAHDFMRMVADVSGSQGEDRAVLVDSSGNDSVKANDYRTRMSGQGSVVVARGFSSVDVQANRGGNDSAILEASAGSDFLNYSTSSTTLSGSDYQIRVNGIDTIEINGLSSIDTGFINGSSGNETLLVTNSTLTLSSKQNRLELNGYSNITVNGGGGIDTIDIREIDADDVLFGRSNLIKSILDGNQLKAIDFTWLDATVVNGETGQADIDAIDYWFDLHGNWNK